MSVTEIFCPAWMRSRSSCVMRPERRPGVVAAGEVVDRVRIREPALVHHVVVERRAGGIVVGVREESVHGIPRLRHLVVREDREGDRLALRARRIGDPVVGARDAVAHEERRQADDLARPRDPRAAGPPRSRSSRGFPPRRRRPSSGRRRRSGRGPRGTPRRCARGSTAGRCAPRRSPGSRCTGASARWSRWGRRRGRCPGPSTSTIGAKLRNGTVNDTAPGSAIESPASSRLSISPSSGVFSMYGATTSSVTGCSCAARLDAEVGGTTGRPEAARAALHELVLEEVRDVHRVGGGAPGDALVLAEDHERRRPGR